jgi:hypothetical protein
VEAQEPDEGREFRRRGTTHQPEPENAMPQPLGSKQEILFRNLVFWQEKIAGLNRFNHIETPSEAKQIDAPTALSCCKYLIIFRNRDSNQHSSRINSGAESQHRFPKAPGEVLLPVGTIDRRLRTAYRGAHVCFFRGG